MTDYEKYGTAELLEEARAAMVRAIAGENVWGNVLHTENVLQIVERRLRADQEASRKATTQRG